MSEQKHTPGPWQWYWRQEDGETNCGVYWEQREGLAYSVCRAPRYATQKQWEANARLIAAAPDLLEALEGLMELERRGRLMPIGREWDAARAALSKATGQSPIAGD